MQHLLYDLIQLPLNDRLCMVEKILAALATNTRENDLSGIINSYLPDRANHYH